MNKHFTITITDDDGVYQFNLHNFVKKALLYVFTSLILIAIFAVGTILYLNYVANETEGKRFDMELAYKDLEAKNTNLYDNIKNSEHLLEVKKKELADVSDSLSEIEELIGLSTPAEVPLKDRISETKLTSQHMATLLQFIPNGSPITYKGITSKYGYRIHPTLHKREFHRGSDMKAKMNTPVYATADGMVEFAGMHKRSGYGRLIILQHNYGFKTYFGHLNKIVIKSGTFIRKGELIAYTGNTGMSNGPHLHYEVRYISRAVNPYWFIKWNVANYQDIFKKEKRIPWQSLIAATANIKVQKPTQTQQSSLLALLLKGK